MRIIFAIACIFFATSLAGETRIVSDRSSDGVALNVTFNGADILIYGAVVSEDVDYFDVVISVVGPSRAITVREKTRKYLFWLNTNKVEFREAPAYNAIVSNRRLDDVISKTERLKYKLGLEENITIRALPHGIENGSDYADALLRLQRKEAKYRLDDFGVNIAGGVLFSSQIPLPADLIEGDYIVDILVTSDKKVIAQSRSILPVFKTGIERWLFDLSQRFGFLYGLLSIAAAIFAALLSAQVVSLFRR